MVLGVKCKAFQAREEGGPMREKYTYAEKYGDAATAEQKVQMHGNQLDDCCMKHNEPGWRKDIVGRVLALWDSVGERDWRKFGSGTDREGTVLFVTSDGKYAVLEDSEDYTGHG